MWISDRAPEAPTTDDYRAESDIVLIQTRSGSLYTARWVSYQDEEIDSCWELEGRDGLQLEAADVVAWQSITPFGGEG